MDNHDSVRAKVAQIFIDAFGERAALFKGGVPARDANDALGVALAEQLEPLVADEVAFHLIDWETDAAFLVAFMMFPERFTSAELQAAVEMFLVHVPAHVQAAARLAGYEVPNILGGGDVADGERPAPLSEAG
ncbi:hypothetical protein [Roseateles terrae]|uniref:Uncharacterized protein n=1 Tax=Roseateles terrae TaxID=431060 RepID=A0ABR6GXP0_9BURK|nr:hypothetical protein [Roseateles terrae]MBB3195883.1 hypothetical protein [Roseateles terrae]OWQ85200.1 hypothetical protein CDN98_17090 [Roseateles terrae]